MNIAHILRKLAAVRPDAAAIIDTNRRRDRITTFAELDLAAARVASILWKQGLRPGDAVLIFYPMSMELYAALLAMFRLQLVAMFLDPSAGREHIEACCALQQPRALIASPRAHLLRLRSKALRAIPAKFVIGLPVPGAVRLCFTKGQLHDEIVDCAPDDAALLTFTSGSTGEPKAAVRTHGFLLNQHRVLAETLQLRAESVDLTTLPIVLLANLASGVTSLIPNADLRYPGAIAAGPVVAQILSHRTVSSVASPAFFECLASHCAERKLTLPSLQKLFTGGAPVFPRHFEQMQTMAPNAEVVAVYGSTEAEPISYIARTDVGVDDRASMLAGQGLLAGTPIASIQVRIVRDSWGQVLGPWTQAEFAGQYQPGSLPGEIVVSGGHVLPGYLNGRGDEETKFRVDGVVWHRTGDAGFLDERGRLWLLGRCAARILDDRGELYPFAAETSLYQNPAVRRAAVVGRRGRRIMAVEFNTGRATPSTADLLAALAWAKVDAVRVCRAIPVDKRHNAKIDYPSLYRMLDDM